MTIQTSAILVTRPHPEAENFARALNAAGYFAIIEPMLTLEAVRSEDEVYDKDEILIFTSAAGVRFLPPVIRQSQQKAICIGPATTAAAQEAGFDIMATMDGGAHNIIKFCRKTLSPDTASFCHIRGVQATLSIDEELRCAGFRARHCITYKAAAAQSLSADTQIAISNNTIQGVTLLSRRTAETFCALSRHNNLLKALSETPFFCISSAVANTVRAAGFCVIHTARHPTQDCILESIQENI